MKEEHNNILDADTKVITTHTAPGASMAPSPAMSLPEEEPTAETPGRKPASSGKTVSGARKRPAGQTGPRTRKKTADQTGPHTGKKPADQTGPHARTRPTGQTSSGTRRKTGGQSRPDAPGKSARQSGHDPNKKRTDRQTAAGKRKRSAGRSPRPGTAALPKPRVSYIHMGILALILLIGIVGIIRLAIWNRGKASDYDPDDVTTEFDTEPEDFHVPPDPQASAQRADDGVTTILLLGNGALAKTRGEDDGIGRRLEELTGGKVYDASLDHTYLSVKNAVYDESYQSDVFSLYWITQCITMGDFTLLEDNARSWDGDDGVGDMVEMLKNLDMDTVDVITIMYDHNDYADGRLLTGPYDETMAASCCGCLLQSLRLLQQTYPHIQIIVSSPYFVCVEDDNSDLQPGSIYNNGQGTLADYMIAYKNIAVVSHVSFVDNYFGTITEDNYESCLEEDSQTLNAKGRGAIAERIAAFISL